MLSSAWLGSLNMDCSLSFLKQICLSVFVCLVPSLTIIAHPLPGSSVQPALWMGPAFGDWHVAQQVENMEQQMKAGKLLEPHA